MNTINFTCEWIVEFGADAVALGPRAPVDKTMLAEFRRCHFWREDFASGSRRRFLTLRFVGMGGFLSLPLFVIPAVVAAAVGCFAFLLLLTSVNFNFLRMLLLLLLLLLMMMMMLLLLLLLLLRFAVTFATFDLATLLLPPMMGAVAGWMATG